jgi:hypothetical protein
MREMTDISTAVAENAQAVQAFVRALQAAGTTWTQPVAPGKWSPGQLAEHLAATYEQSRQVLDGTADIKPMPAFVRPLFRALVVNRALKANSFPEGGRAPASFQPSADPPAMEEAVARLIRASDAFEREVARQAATPGYLVHHPVFGHLQPGDYLRFQALHTAHHTGHLRGN